jgi:glycopeptide antibiotics resistance protein
VLTPVAWFLPGVACSIIVSLVVAPSLSRKLRTSRNVATLLVLSLGAILSATVTPIQGTWGVPLDRACDFSRVGFAPLVDMFTVNDNSLNVALFVPLGWALGLLPNTRLKLGLILVALTLPFEIEALQLWASALARGCESADVIDNLTGAGLGFASATALSWLVHQSNGGPTERP